LGLLVAQMRIPTLAEFLHRQLSKPRSRLDERTGILVYENEAGPINRMIWAYRTSAEQRGHAFLLMRSEFDQLVRQPCHYCGVVAGNRNGFNGIDRVDNNRGYVTDNVVPCCGQCNFAKGSLTMAEWEAWLRRIAERWV
jgi:hypothetical protein